VKNGTICDLHVTVVGLSFFFFFVAILCLIYKFYKTIKLVAYVSMPPVALTKLSV